MKKIISIMLAVLMLAVLVSCSGDVKTSMCKIKFVQGSTVLGSYEVQKRSLLEFSQTVKFANGDIYTIETGDDPLSSEFLKYSLVHGDTRLPIYVDAEMTVRLTMAHLYTAVYEDITYYVGN